MVVKTRKRSEKKVPRAPSEDRHGFKVKEVHCANPECGKFLGYESIQIGLIRQSCHRCKQWTETSTLAPDQKPVKMREVRCGQCGRFLYYEAMVYGIVKKKCRGCGVWNTLDIEPPGGIIVTDAADLGRKAQ